MAQDDILKGLDEKLKASMKAFDAPGLAVVALKNNEIIYSKGFGYRDVPEYDLRA